MSHYTLIPNGYAGEHKEITRKQALEHIRSFRSMALQVTPISRDGWGRYRVRVVHNNKEVRAYFQHRRCAASFQKEAEQAAAT